MGLNFGAHILPAHIDLEELGVNKITFCLLSQNLLFSITVTARELNEIWETIAICNWSIEKHKFTGELNWKNSVLWIDKEVNK